MFPDPPRKGLRFNFVTNWGLFKLNPSLQHFLARKYPNVTSFQLNCLRVSLREKVFIQQGTQESDFTAHKLFVCEMVLRGRSVSILNYPRLYDAAAKWCALNQIVTGGAKQVQTLLQLGDCFVAVVKKDPHRAGSGIVILE